MTKQTRDPLDGYRGNVVDFGRNLVEATDKPDDAIWDRIFLGTAALKLMQGVASKDDIALVMGRIVAQCEMDAQMACQQFIACEDPASPEARKAHFDARVSAAIVGRLNQMVTEAQAAGDEYNTTGPVRLY